MSDAARIADALERIAVALESANEDTKAAALRLEQERHDALMAKAKALAEYQMLRRLGTPAA